MRTWLLILLVLAGLWMLAKPGRVDQKIENRVEQAVALTADCKLDEARKELATLKADSARPAQLRRLQSAITQATPGCDKKRQRGKAWSDTVDAIEKLLDGSSLEKASARLAAFMRRWGEAADTREARARIEAKRAERLLDEADACLKRRDRACARNRLEAAERVGAQGMEARLQTVREALARPAEADASSSRPQSRSGTGNGASRSSTATRESTVATDSVPPDGSFTSAEQVAQERERHRVQQVRNILADSNTDILKGNYQGAVERLRYCTGTVDPGNRSCAELRETAERMNRDMLRCVRDGGAWVNGACQ
jgi:hypothetical protein